MKKKSVFILLWMSSFIFYSCNSNLLDDNLIKNNGNDKNLSIIKESFKDSISMLNIDTTSIIFKSMRILKNGKRYKVASSPMYTQSASESLFDLRDFPVNIIVKESTNGTRFLTAKGSPRLSTPAYFAQKQDDNTNISQTFYLSYVPLVGEYCISTKINGITYPMSIGSYTSNPNNKFLYARNGSARSEDAFTFNFSDNEASSYYIQSSLWFGSDDPNNPTSWNVWDYTLGCNNSAVYFDKYRNISSQQFIITPLDNFTITKIEYQNDQTALLEKVPDFVVNWSANNATSVSQQMSTNFGSTASKTSTFSRTLGVSLTVSASAKVGIPFIADGKITTTANTSSSATWGESSTTQDTRNYNFQIIVPARRRVVATASVSRYHMKLNYTAYLTGVNTGRTIKVTGVWDGVDCTDIVTNFTEYDLLTNSFIKTTTIKGLRNEVVKL